MIDQIKVVRIPAKNGSPRIAGDQKGYGKKGVPQFGGRKIVRIPAEKGFSKAHPQL